MSCNTIWEGKKYGLNLLPFWIRLFKEKNGLHEKPESSLGAEKTLQNVVLCLKGLS